mmetsp:Transcript_104163/g.335907  ORF Transcript_104163/g.335907 Transcript_104163/m.335907 type:complete len:400 (+) Transcript_104163:1387-2586(+)
MRSFSDRSPPSPRSPRSALSPRSARSPRSPRSPRSERSPRSPPPRPRSTLLPPPLPPRPRPLSGFSAITALLPALVSGAWSSISMRDFPAAVAALLLGAAAPALAPNASRSSSSTVRMVFSGGALGPKSAASPLATRRSCARMSPSAHWSRPPSTGPDVSGMSHISFGSFFVAQFFSFCPLLPRGAGCEVFASPPPPPAFSHSPDHHASSPLWCPLFLLSAHSQSSHCPCCQSQLLPFSQLVSCILELELSSQWYLLPVTPSHHSSLLFSTSRFAVAAGFGPAKRIAGSGGSATDAPAVELSLTALAQLWLPEPSLPPVFCPAALAARSSSLCARFSASLRCFSSSLSMRSCSFFSSSSLSFFASFCCFLVCTTPHVVCSWFCLSSMMLATAIWICCSS